MTASNAWRCSFDLPALSREVAELEAESAKPDLWQDRQRAQKILKRLGAQRDRLTRWERFRAREPRGSALGAIRRTERRRRDLRGGRRHRRRRLGRDARANVPALGGAARVQGGAARLNARRRGWFPQRDSDR